MPTILEKRPVFDIDHADLCRGPPTQVKESNVRPVGIFETQEKPRSLEIDHADSCGESCGNVTENIKHVQLFNIDHADSRRGSKTPFDDSSPTPGQNQALSRAFTIF